MKKVFFVLVGLAVIGGLAGAGFLAYTWFAGDVDPSGETTAPTLVAGESGNQQVYRINQAESEARFRLQEDLRGQRATVVGVTNDVAGDILVDFDDPAQSQVGTIRINARTLATDNEFRNRAIRSNILDTRNHEFIIFTPTALLNFPDNPQVGEALDFQIEGELTITDITREVTWEATVTLVSEDRMRGTATTQVLRDDFNLSIPDAPGVANVTNEVTLTIEFVANAVDEAQTDSTTEGETQATEDANDQ